MKGKIDRTPTVSTIESYGTDMPNEHYRYFKERYICGISGPVFLCSVFILICFLILLGILAIIVFVILHHTL
ncbi:hypothetical protein L5515_014671 [Caenorhabditis briggsae]|uniref:Uncharacterized protein n=2 Tax=Caenorhabditis TaxID=6237 RepID=A0AAE9J8C1_CAEBR|nr:hypothetical protein B9Z55_006293 [Caenorhabditis nigoni]ULU06828.1 hypothetical protein L3Y34_018548 [Caenorhabditis briggsae]UMM18754.1 hypothetical protein L5515_014671 [Caenorhabditis briggsae]